MHRSTLLLRPVLCKNGGQVAFSFCFLYIILLGITSEKHYRILLCLRIRTRIVFILVTRKESCYTILNHKSLNTKEDPAVFFHQKA